MGYPESTLLHLLFSSFPKGAFHLQLFRKGTCWMRATQNVDRSPDAEKIMAETWKRALRSCG